MSLLLLYNSADVIIGNAVVAEANDTANSSAKLGIIAQAGVTDVADILTASATPAIKATLSQAEAADALDGQARLPVQIHASLIEAADMPVSAGAIALAGSAAIAEADDASAGAGAVAITAGAALIELDDTVIAQTFMGRVPLPYRKGGDGDWKRHEREKRWRDDLRRIIDEAWRIAGGEIDPVTRAELPPSDLSRIRVVLSRKADRKDFERAMAIAAAREQHARDEAIAVLLLAA